MNVHLSQVQPAVIPATVIAIFTVAAIMAVTAVYILDVLHNIFPSEVHI